MNYLQLFRVTLPETILEVAALLVLVVDLGLLRKAAQGVRLGSAVTLGVLGCLAAIVGVQLEGPHWLTLGGMDATPLLATGGYTAVAQYGILALTAVTLLFLFDSDFTRHVGEFVAVVLMAASGGLLIAAAQDLLVIFIGLELLSLGLYILTAFSKSSGKSAEAAIKYYLFGGMSAAFLLFGFSYFYGLTGTTSVSLIQSRITLSGASPLLFIAWILVAAGLGFKVAAVPFHLWAPDTYEGAPAPSAAFIASVSKVASFALLVTLAVNWWVRPSSSGALIGATQDTAQTWPALGMILMIVSAASMVWGNLAALAQSSVRRLLAYSAIAHAGYMLLAIAVSPVQRANESAAAMHAAGEGSIQHAMQSVLYYVLTYGITTIGAFGLVAVVERATGSDRMDAFLGLRKRSPLLAGVLLVLFLSLAGIPPLVGFWAKFNLFAAVLREDSAAGPLSLVCLAIAMSAVSLYYYLQVLKRAFVMPAVDESPLEVHPVVLMTLVAIAVAVVLLGVFPSFLAGWIAGF